MKIVKKLENKGFAISGILYPILILTLFLVVQILAMMASRKAILDKNKQQLLDSVNASNKIYTNEELSILLAEANEKIKVLENNSAKIQVLESNLEKNNSNVSKMVSDLDNLKSLVEKRGNLVQERVSNLNSMTDKNNYLVAFTPETIGKPSYCYYGIVENIILGTASDISHSYWHFQIAHCTETSAVFVRQRVNNNTDDSWTSWAQL